MTDPKEVRPRVLVAAELRPLLPEEPLPGFDLVWIRTEDPTPQGDFVAIIPLLSRPIGEAELAGLPNLQVVAQCAVGYDNINVPDATARRIPVSNTPGVLTNATAEMAWALLFAAGRRVVESDSLMRSGNWPGWGPMQFIGGDVTGATLGLVGAGRIGTAMAMNGAAAHAFCHIIYKA